MQFELVINSIDQQATTALSVSFSYFTMVIWWIPRSALPYYMHHKQLGKYHTIFLFPIQIMSSLHIYNFLCALTTSILSNSYVLFICSPFRHYSWTPSSFQYLLSVSPTPSTTWYIALSVHMVYSCSILFISGFNVNLMIFVFYL